MTDQILEKYRQSPSSPGIYMMKDARGKIIYVGKAKNLKKRLASYFIKKQNHDPKTAALLETIKDFHLVITASDHEAFILESNLIKEHNPKYNVILKDGKNYPLLRINMNEAYPAIEKVRKIQNDNALYFGPYSSAFSINKTLKQIQKVFQLRRCKKSQFKNRSRPCLNFQIKACLGLCCNKVDSKEYKKTVQDAVLFLKGRSNQVLKKLKSQMLEYSATQEYEKAGKIRDNIFAIENILEKQVVVAKDMKDRDVIALAAKKGRAVVAVFIVRSGHLIDSAYYPVDLGFKEPNEVLYAFLEQYYKKNLFIPPAILLDQEIENKEIIQENLSDKKGKKVVVSIPQRGEKKHLVQMAHINAVKELEKRIQKEEEERSSMLMLKDLLKMDRLPERIECFDNSNIAGHEPVSAMIVFKDGKPEKSSYRKYIIKDMDLQDDYAYMYQTLERRFTKKEKDLVFPDLLVVDGGKGQLGMAMAVLKDLDIDKRFMVAGLAKKNEEKEEKYDKVYIPGRSNPLNTNNALKALYLLERVRDEAHRFAISFQRKRREKIAGLSELDAVPGIGPKRKKALLMHFKGVANIKKASIEDIISLPEMNEKSARILLDNLN